CRIDAKSDADVCCVRPALARGNVRLLTRATATRLVTNGAGSRVTAVEFARDGERLRAEAPIVVVSCGAVNSAAPLLRSASDRHPVGLANSWGLVGRRFMAHLAAMIQSFHPRGSNGGD